MYLFNPEWLFGESFFSELGTMGVQVKPMGHRGFLASVLIVVVAWFVEVAEVVVLFRLAKYVSQAVDVPVWPLLYRVPLPPEEGAAVVVNV